MKYKNKEGIELSYNGHKNDLSVQLVKEVIRESIKVGDDNINTRYPMYSYAPGSKQIDGVTSATSKYFASKGLLYTYRDGKRVDPTHLHIKDWLEAIRMGGQPKCNIEVALHEAVACHMATESYLQGRRIEWDPVNRKLI